MRVRLCVRVCGRAGAAGRNNIKWPCPCPLCSGGPPPSTTVRSTSRTRGSSTTNRCRPCVAAGARLSTPARPRGRPARDPVRAIVVCCGVGRGDKRSSVVERPLPRNPPSSAHAPLCNHPLSGSASAPGCGGAVVQCRRRAAVRLHMSKHNTCCRAPAPFRRRRCLDPPPPAYPGHRNPYEIIVLLRRRLVSLVWCLLASPPLRSASLRFAPLRRPAWPGGLGRTHPAPLL